MVRSFVWAGRMPYGPHKTLCPLQSRCTTGTERQITRWEHEHLIDAMRERLSRDIDPMTLRRCTVEHPFGTIGAHPFPDAEADERAHRNGVECLGLQHQAGCLADRHPATGAGHSGLIRAQSPVLRRGPAFGETYRVATREKGRTGTAMPGRMENHLQTDPPNWFGHTLGRKQRRNPLQTLYRISVL